MPDLAGKRDAVFAARFLGGLYDGGFDFSARARSMSALPEIHSLQTSLSKMQSKVAFWIGKIKAGCAQGGRFQALGRFFSRARFGSSAGHCTM
jgi:hypothetical protein